MAINSGFVPLKMVIFHSYVKLQEGMFNNVLSAKIEEPVWYTINHHRNLLLKGFLQTPLLINPGLTYTKTDSGWWFQPTPLKNDGVSSSVGMIIPFPTFPNYIWKVIQNSSRFQTTNQSQ